MAGGAYRSIAKQFGASESAVYRHLQDHLPKALVQAQAAEEVAQADRVMEELQRCFQRVNLLFDACDRWLRDPEDLSRYDIGPRAEDVSIIYMETDADGKERRVKAQLSTLLAKIEGAGYGIVLVESKYADPRELVLKTANRLQGQTELLATSIIKTSNEREKRNKCMYSSWLVEREFNKDGQGKRDLYNNDQR